MSMQKSRKGKHRKIRRIGAIGNGIGPPDLLPASSLLAKLAAGFVFGLLGVIAQAKESAAPAKEIDNVEELIEDKDNSGSFIPKQ